MFNPIVLFIIWAIPAMAYGLQLSVALLSDPGDSKNSVVAWALVLTAGVFWFIVLPIARLVRVIHTRHSDPTTLRNPNHEANHIQ